MGLTAIDSGDLSVLNGHMEELLHNEQWNTVTGEFPSDAMPPRSPNGPNAGTVGTSNQHLSRNSPFRLGSDSSGRHTDSPAQPRAARGRPAPMPIGLEAQALLNTEAKKRKLARAAGSSSSPDKVDTPLLPPLPPSKFNTATSRKSFINMDSHTPRNIGPSSEDLSRPDAIRQSRRPLGALSASDALPPQRSQPWPTNSARVSPPTDRPPAPSPGKQTTVGRIGIPSAVAGPSTFHPKVGLVRSRNSQSPVKRSNVVQVDGDDEDDPLEILGGHDGAASHERSPSHKRAVSTDHDPSKRADNLMAARGEVRVIMPHEPGGGTVHRNSNDSQSDGGRSIIPPRSTRQSRSPDKDPRRTASPSKPGASSKTRGPVIDVTGNEGPSEPEEPVEEDLPPIGHSRKNGAKKKRLVEGQDSQDPIDDPDDGWSTNSKTAHVTDSSSFSPPLDKTVGRAFATARAAEERAIGRVTSPAGPSRSTHVAQDDDSEIEFVVGGDAQAIAKSRANQKDRRPMRGKTGQIVCQGVVKSEPRAQESQKTGTSEMSKETKNAQDASPRANPRRSGVVPSSGLKGDHPGSIDVAHAWIYAGSSYTTVIRRMEFKTSKRDENMLEFWSSGTGQGMIVFRLPLTWFHRATMCLDPSHPLLMLELRIAEHQSRLPVGAEIQALSTLSRHAVSAQECLTATLYVSFKDNDTKAVDLLQLLKGFLADSGMTCPTVDKSGCMSLNKPPVEPGGSSKAKSARKSVMNVESPTPKQNLASRMRGKPKAADDSTQSQLRKEHFLPTDRPVRPRRSGADTKYAEPSDDPEEDVPKAVDRSSSHPPRTSGLTEAQRNLTLFNYLANTRHAVSITIGELHRLRSGDFLNDTLIEFGLKYVLEQHPGIKDQAHLFSSFFYEKLTNRKNGQVYRKENPDVWGAYDSIKRWTKGIDIFEKQYIVVPINESFHWYLAVIVNPKGVLEVPVPPAPATNVGDPTEEQAPIGTRTISAQTVSDDAEATRSMDRSVAESMDVDEDHHMNDSTSAALALEQGQTPYAQKTRPRDPHQSNESEDPIGDGMYGDTTGDTSIVETKMRDLSTNDVSAPEVGDAPLNSSTWDALHSQSREPDQPRKRRQNYAHESSPSEEGEVAEMLLPPENKKFSVPRDPDYEIIGSQQCWIFTFDSMGGGHGAVRTTLNRWLHFEARNKREHTGPLSEAEYCDGAVPQQPNYSDCGLYLIYFLSQLLERPTEIMTFLQERRPLTKWYESAEQGRKAKEDYHERAGTVWNKEDTGKLREVWSERIIDETRKARGDEAEALLAQGGFGDAGIRDSENSAAVSGGPVAQEGQDPNASQLSDGPIELSQPPPRPEAPEAIEGVEAPLPSGLPDETMIDPSLVRDGLGLDIDPDVTVENEQPESLEQEHAPESMPEEQEELELPDEDQGSTEPRAADLDQQASRPSSPHATAQRVPQDEYGLDSKELDVQGGRFAQASANYTSRSPRSPASAILPEISESLVDPELNQHPHAGLPTAVLEDFVSATVVLEPAPDRSSLWREGPGSPVIDSDDEDKENAHHNGQASRSPILASPNFSQASQTANILVSQPVGAVRVPDPLASRLVPDSPHDATRPTKRQKRDISPPQEDPRARESLSEGAHSYHEAAEQLEIANGSKADPSAVSADSAVVLGKQSEAHHEQPLLTNSLPLSPRTRYKPNGATHLDFDPQPDDPQETAYSERLFGGNQLTVWRDTEYPTSSAVKQSRKGSLRSADGGVSHPRENEAGSAANAAEGVEVRTESTDVRLVEESEQADEAQAGATIAAPNDLAQAEQAGEVGSSVRGRVLTSPPRLGQSDHVIRSPAADLIRAEVDSVQDTNDHDRTTAMTQNVPSPPTEEPVDITRENKAATKRPRRSDTSSIRSIQEVPPPPSAFTRVTRSTRSRTGTPVLADTSVLADKSASPKNVGVPRRTKRFGSRSTDGGPPPRKSKRLNPMQDTSADEPKAKPKQVHDAVTIQGEEISLLSLPSPGDVSLSLSGNDDERESNSRSATPDEPEPVAVLRGQDDEEHGDRNDDSDDSSLSPPSSPSGGEGTSVRLPASEHDGLPQGAQLDEKWQDLAAKGKRAASILSISSTSDEAGAKLNVSRRQTRASKTTKGNKQPAKASRQSKLPLERMRKTNDAESSTAPTRPLTSEAAQGSSSLPALPKPHRAPITYGTKGIRRGMTNKFARNGSAQEDPDPSRDTETDLVDSDLGGSVKANSNLGPGLGADDDDHAGDGPPAASSAPRAGQRSAINKTDKGKGAAKLGPGGGTGSSFRFIQPFSGRGSKRTEEGDSSVDEMLLVPRNSHTKGKDSEEHEGEPGNRAVSRHKRAGKKRTGLQKGSSAAEAIEVD